jgi:hypothetical protein
MKVQDKFSITSINLKEPQIRILEFLLSSYLKDEFFLTEQKDASVQVIELPSENATKTLNAYKQQYSNSYFIILSDSQVESYTVSVVCSPVSPKKLLDALNTTLSKVKLLAARKKQQNLEQKQKQLQDRKRNNIVAKQRVFKKEAIKKNNKKKKLILIEEEKKDECDFYSDLDQYVKSAAFHQFKHKKTETESIHLNTAYGQKKGRATLVFKDPKEKIMHNKNKLIDINKDKLSFMSSRPDINLNNKALMSKINYQCDDYLQGKLTGLFANKENNAITTAYCFIVYNTKNHTAYVNVNNRTLQNIAAIASLNMGYSSVDIERLIKEKEVQWEDADAVLWKVSIWASRGRLPLLLNDLDRRFSLLCWPNLTRFMMTPHAMEIAVLWLDKPISLRESLALLDIPQRYVFSFYSAVVALALISFEKEPATELPLKQKKCLIKNKTKRTGVLGKLLHFFKPNDIEEL